MRARVWKELGSGVDFESANLVKYAGAHGKQETPHPVA